MKYRKEKMFYMKKILGIIVMLVLVLALTIGCGNNDTKNLGNKKEGTKENNSSKEKIVVCKRNFNNRMESVYLKGDKLIKVVNSVDDVDCDGIKRIFGPLNDIKGTSVNITCSENGEKAHHEETYIIDEIEDFSILTGERYPNQISSTYLEPDTHKFNLKFWLEGKDTQGYTCEEREVEN